ncbi:hypothetical protein BJV82DRAFT_607116 [Fennellomyces sp. T-0311]|nr:hypothetical protein BJV82DRAFT_607116 [Fennellomyces sp. T-0311]
MSSALARRGSKSAATACKHQHRNYFSNTFFRRDAITRNIRPTDMVWLLTATTLGCRSITRRTLRAKSEQLAPRTMVMVDDTVVSEQSNRRTNNPFHPRRIGKGCDLDSLFQHLAEQSHHLGPERVFKSLRAALYNASGYRAEPAWRIYQQMIHHDVTDRMSANHYGHLLNILKYGNDQTTIARMLLVLSYIPDKSSMHYSQVLFAMGRVGDAAGACQLIKDMQSDGVAPSSSHFTSLAIAAKNDKHNGVAIQEAAELMMDAMKTRGMVLENDACVTMISLLSRRDKPSISGDGIDKTVKFLEAVESVSAQKKDEGDTPPARYNAHMYTTLISGLAHKGDATNAKRLYDEMRQQGLKPTIATRTALIEAYGRAGDFDTALKLLNRKHKRNHAMVTSVLTNAIRHNKWDVAEELAVPWMDRLEHAKTDDKLRAALLWIKVKSSMDEAREFFDMLYQKDSSYVNSVMVNHLVTESGNQRSQDKVKDSFDLHRLTGPPSLYSQHLLVDALFKCRDVPAALSAFMNMRRQGIPDDITMAMVVRGLVMNDEDTTAWNVFRALKSGNLQPNLWAYTSMLKAFAKTQPSKGIPRELLALWPELHSTLSGTNEAPALKPLIANPSQAYMLFREMTGYQTPNEYTYTTLIACFSKHSLARAAEVFSHMCAAGVKPTVQTYTVMLQACAIFRSARIALLVFRHMRDQQVTPNEATWHYLLKALVRARVEKAKIDEVGQMAREAMAKKKIT